ncbi:MAG: Lrp/AsnC family transcriptional regulator [Candidatus Nanohaloarchaea archaeon]
MELKQDYQKILYQLEEDARQSFTDIGRDAGVSQQTVSYAVDRMQEDGIIRDVSPLFDYTKFGFNGYVTLFRVNTFSRETLEELEAVFRRHEMAAWVTRLAGGWDLLVFFLAPNASYFNKAFKELVADYPEQLRTYRILTSVVIHDMGRGYLGDTGMADGLEDIIVGGDRNVLELSDAEQATAEQLYEDALASSVEMGAAMDVTAKTVIDRIRRLEERSLVKGYRPVLGVQELGITASLLFIDYTKHDVEQEDALVDYCVAHPNVTLLMKTFGDWDVMLRVEAGSRGEAREAVRSIREQFEEVILDYDTLEVLDDVTKRYLPPGFFQDDALVPLEE